jgi:hypothetical protein
MLERSHLISQFEAAAEIDSRITVNKLANAARNCIEPVSTLSRSDAVVSEKGEVRHYDISEQRGQQFQHRERISANAFGSGGSLHEVLLPHIESVTVPLIFLLACACIVVAKAMTADRRTLFLIDMMFS